MAREKESLNRVKNNPSKLWSEAKKQMYGNQNQHPERIMENNKLVVGSKKVSHIFNRFFITKVRKMREEMSNFLILETYLLHGWENVVIELPLFVVFCHNPNSTITSIELR